MSTKILINAVDLGECRIARINNGQLEEFHIETSTREITKGNIYKGKITRIEPSLQAVFVDYGAERHGFLQKQEIHSDYFMEDQSGSQSIERIVKPGQELLVQVTKDPIMKKGAMLTTYISLPGRLVVLMPGSNNLGVSRKIEDEEERKRQKEIIEKLSLPEDFGLIIRTAGKDCSKTLIHKDLTYLMRLWKNIKKKGMQEESPALLYKERNIAVRSIRDYFSSDIVEILIDDELIFKEVKEFVSIVAPKQSRIVRKYKLPEPLFARYQIENQISSIFENRVNLSSGGYIVIEQTEALVSIDVNSGKATQKKNIEETAYQTNIEAAEEIARQLRIRDLGGLIVIDFIDMKEQKKKTGIEKALRNFLKLDKARTKTGKISKFGLLEMSRQRIRPSIEFGSYEVCKRCNGKGLTPAIETLGVRFVRKLQLEALKKDIQSITAVVPVSLADFLVNRKRKEIFEIENRQGIKIFIQGRSDMDLLEEKITIEKKKSS